MFKKLLITLVALTGMAFGQAVHTPTLEGTYTWTGADTWTFGSLHFRGSIPQCPDGQAVTGLQEDFTPNCGAAGGGAGFNWSVNLGSSQGSTDTTAVLNSAPSGLTAPGTFLVDGEYETFTGITGATLTGITRGVSLTTPAAHGSGAAIYSVNLAFSPFTQAPWGGLFGGAGKTWAALNCGTPAQLFDAGATTVFQVNCFSDETWIDDAGRIHQENGSVANYFSPFYVGRGATGVADQLLPLEITDTTDVVQTNGLYQMAQPIGLSGTYGPLTTQPVPTIPAATMGGETGGSCSATYDLTGLDLDGNTVPGTPVTLTGLLPWIFGVQGLVNIQAPQFAGIATWKLYRTALSGTCGAVTTTGLIATSTTPYPFFQDNAIVGDSTTAPTTNASVAKQCVGNAGNPELYCQLSGTSSSPPVGCGAATYGWDYTQTTATSGGKQHCYSGQVTWTSISGSSGLASINGDTTPAQTLVPSGGGLAINTAGGVTTFTLAGGGLTGAVAPGNYGQMGNFAATGGSTTINPTPNFYALNPAWSVTQMNNLFTRFNGTVSTSWALTSNVVVFQAPNSYSVGDGVIPEGLATGSFMNGSTLTVTAATATSWTAAFTHANGSATEASTAFITGAAGLVLIPPGVTEGPASAYNNTNAITSDMRKEYAWHQASQYGLQCDERVLTVTLTGGSNQVDVGSSFGSVSPIGMTMAVGLQTGYGSTGTQYDWEPLVTGFSFPNITLSANVPSAFNGATITAVFGTDNHDGFVRAFKDLGQINPLYIPVGCGMYTSTVRWPGTNIVGQQANFGGITGPPGLDIFQQQDGTPIHSWSISGSVTTFTIPAYAAHNIMVGDSIELESFPTSTFFNGSTITIASIPTPTTFTVASAFGQGTSSGSEFGVAAPTTSANTNGLRVENLTFSVNNAIDPSFTWTHYDTSATSTVEPPMYRPVALHNEPANNPFGPGFGLNAVNGIAKIAQNSAVICISTTVVGGNTPRIPVVGTTIEFPYQGAGLFSATVSSTAGSCSGSFTPITLSAALPNTSAFTAAVAEWFTYTTAQTLSVAIPATITYPHTITINLPIAPVAGYESNVSSHGSIFIGSDRFDYMGTFLGTTNGTSQLILRDGPTSVNGGAGDAIGAVVFPGNPCSAMYNNPWPVVPTLISGEATPLFATYYPGLCAGNAALSFPNADAIAYTGESAGLSVVNFHDIFVGPTQENALGNKNNNGGMFMYEQGNNTGYGNTINNIRDNFTWGGIIQGPASVNQHGVRAVGPTSTGQTIRDCTFRTGFPIILMGMQQSVIDRCDTYTTEISPYDGTQVGAATTLNLGYSLSELDGNGVTDTGQISIRDWNGENENGNGEEFPPGIISDCNNCTWLGSIFEGGFNIFGGSFQQFHGTFMSGPMFNYGINNYFEHIFGPTIGYNDSNIYDGSNSFWNWGKYGTCQVSVGSSGGPMQGCGPGYMQSYDGHDVWASMMGNNLTPTENVLGGMIPPDELGAGTGMPVIFDSTEPWWGKHIECPIGSGLECVGSQFDGFNGYIYIGPHKRVTNGQMVLKTLLKLKNAGTASVRILLSATNGGSFGTCSPNFSLAGATTLITSSAWTPVQIPVDFTPYGSCTLGVQFDNGTATNVLEVGYFNFIPFTGQLYIPLGTHNVNDACPVAGEISLDTAHLWTCNPTSGVAFGAGTWQEH